MARDTATLTTNTKRRKVSWMISLISDDH
jgi:hypothetical protein